MADASTWSLRLFATGLVTGFVAMAVGVATANLPGFQATIVTQGRAAVVVTPPGLIALDVLVIASFLLAVAGVGLAGRPAPSESRKPAAGTAAPSRGRREAAPKPWLQGRRHPRRTT